MVSLSALIGDFQRQIRSRGKEQAPALLAPTYGTLLRPLDDPQLEKRFYGGMAGLASDVQLSVKRRVGWEAS